VTYPAPQPADNCDARKRRARRATRAMTRQSDTDVVTFFDALKVFGSIFHGSDLAIASYDDSVVKIRNAASSLVRFEKKKILFRVEKNALHYFNAGVAVVTSKVVVGLAPGSGQKIQIATKLLCKV
jgi:hypothetical protein